MATHAEYFKAALLSPINISIAVLLLAVGAISVNLIPLLLLGVFEVAWLGVAPMLPAFRRSIDARTTKLTVEALQNSRARQIDALPADLRRRAQEFAARTEEIRRHPALTARASDPLVTRILQNLETAGERHVALLSRLSLLALEQDSGPSSTDPELARRQAEVQSRLAERREACETQLGQIEGTMALLRSQVVLMTETGQDDAAVRQLLDEFDVMQETAGELSDSLADFDRRLSS